MCWFDALDEGSIRSFEELARAFDARFITCNRVPRPLEALLSMAIREGEILKTYSDQYWEMYNEVDGDFEDVAVRTFKVGLPTKHDLKKSLIMKSASNMRQLMDRLEKYKRLEGDQIQGKGKAKAFLKKKDPRGGGYHNDRPRKDFPSHLASEGVHIINSLFKEPVH
ncbi:uncharacterized protein LOC112021709 [Quercus suber]|uniref:uncharacterized protein LOC112021709 n=1 Tax=Quercus suber TaxID=58331 RepID=UPI000CE1A28B|nr:uncharacterized protein LOC112021709 [Quercus suber]XP_023910045.1 uncharacterized protein LOC112021710 [Quercus suber]